MAKGRYEHLDKKDLLIKIAQLEKKRYGLVWEDKPEEVADRCERELPVLVHQPDKDISEDPNGPTNLLIEGDNYHALFALNFTHRRKIDVIYIDPPYNTGAKDWKYNNEYVDKNDRFRHSKWLSMMSKRLRLAKGLLKSDGAIVVAIDDYEVHHLGVLLEELFPGFEIDLVIVEHHPQGAGSNTISRTHEYAFVCTPAGLGFKGRQMRDANDSWSLRRSGQGENNWRKNRSGSFFAIHVETDTRSVMGVGPEIPKDQRDYPLGPTEEGYKRIYPIDREGKERVWRFNRSSMKKKIEQGLIEYSRRGSLKLKKDSEVQVPVFSIWDHSRYNAGTFGSSLLTKIMGTTNTFDYPKSIWTVFDLLKLLHHDKTATILDFYAGSGTTGHAVLELNKQDNGQRKFILCTNNENGIAQEVCFPRISRVIRGYENKGTEKFLLAQKPLTAKNLRVVDVILEEFETIKEEKNSEYSKFEESVEENQLRLYGHRAYHGNTDGLGGNVRYFTTDFVPFVLTDNDKRVLVQRSTELLCIAEDTFEKVAASKRKNEYAIFKNARHSTAIIYDEDAIGDCIAKLNDLKPKGTTAIYVFSYDQEYEKADFKYLKVKATIKPIPEAILNVYRKNAKLRKK